MNKVSNEQSRWQAVQDLFFEASQLPDEEQPIFVRSAVGVDEELGSSVLAMLAIDRGDSFLDRDIELVADEVFSQPESFPFETIGPYRLQRRLGEGGMGVVYLAERDDWHSKVALKVPRDTWISSDRLKRFADEQRLLAQLIHPSIARIYESGTQPNAIPWFAMEYVDGQPITGYFESRDLPIRERLKMFVQVCDAVQYAHSQTIIHRDLKPSNIFITSAGEVKLLDFGIAKQLGESRDATQTRVGQQPVTLAYAAPEQLLENKVSTQTDVYALGVILYQALTGELPFTLSDLTPAQAQDVVTTEAPAKPSLAARHSAAKSAREAAPANLAMSEWADLDILILTAMHKDVKQRYASVDALKRDINHYLRGEPLEARPDSMPYRLRKFLKRRRVPVLAAAAMFATVVGLVGFYTVRLSEARDAAVAEAARTRLARDFTQKLFEGDDYEVGPSKDMRVITLLDRGLKKADALKGDPVQQGELYTTLGSLFLNLGEYGKAETTLHSAYKILSSAAPASHEFAEVLVDLGLLSSNEAHNKAAQSYVRQGLALEQGKTPPDKRLIFKYEVALAYTLVDEDPAAAISILESALTNQWKTTDEEPLSDVWSLLSTAHLNLGHWPQAEDFTRRVLSYVQKTRPANHPDIATEMVNLAHIQFHQEHYEEAEATFRQAIAIDNSWYPKDHPETGDVMRMLAEALFAQHRYDDAAPIAREALSVEQKAYRNLHPRVAYALQILGRLALENGGAAEAEKEFKREIAILRALKERTNLPIATAYLGDVYVREKSYKQAEQCYRNSVALFRNSPSEHADKLNQTNRKLGEALVSQGRYNEAEAPLLESYRSWTKKPPVHEEELATTRKDLAAVYAALKEPEKLQNMQSELSGGNRVASASSH